MKNIRLKVENDDGLRRGVVDFGRQATRAYIAVTHVMHTRNLPEFSFIDDSGEERKTLKFEDVGRMTVEFDD